MKRVFTALSLASAFAVGLAAQQSTTAGQDTQQGQRGPRSVTITGCLRAGDTAGTYMLTDVTGLPAMGRRGGSTSAATGATTTAGAESGTQSSAGTSVRLNPAADVDLAPHVGHKIEVTGTMGGGRRGGGAAGTTMGGTAAGGTTAGAAATTTTGAEGQGRGRGMMRTVSATSVRMISDSCS